MSSAFFRGYAVAPGLVLLYMQQLTLDPAMQHKLKAGYLHNSKIQQGPPPTPPESFICTAKRDLR